MSQDCVQLYESLKDLRVSRERMMSLLLNLVHSMLQNQQHLQIQQDGLFMQPTPASPSELQDLWQENLLLNNTIKQYESTLVAIMSKFRQQTDEIQAIKSANAEGLLEELAQEKLSNEQLRQENLKLAEELQLCRQIMREALALDDQDALQQETQLP